MFEKILKCSTEQTMMVKCDRETSLLDVYESGELQDIPQGFSVEKEKMRWVLIKGPFGPKQDRL